MPRCGQAFPHWLPACLAPGMQVQTVRMSQALEGGGWAHSGALRATP